MSVEDSTLKDVDVQVCEGQAVDLTCARDELIFIQLDTVQYEFVNGSDCSNANSISCYVKSSYPRSELIKQ